MVIVAVAAEAEAVISLVVVVVRGGGGGVSSISGSMANMKILNVLSISLPHFQLSYYYSPVPKGRCTTQPDRV